MQSLPFIEDSPPLSPVDVFAERCDARAILVANHQMELCDAVDAMQAAAERDGLVEAIGQDAVQEIMARAFGTGPA